MFNYAQYVQLCSICSIMFNMFNYVQYLQQIMFILTQFNRSFYYGLLKKKERDTQFKKNMVKSKKKGKIK